MPIRRGHNVQRPLEGRRQQENRSPTLQSQIALVTFLGTVD
jgi:hypothetical protein